MRNWRLLTLAIVGALSCSAQAENCWDKVAEVSNSQKAESLVSELGEIHATYDDGSRAYRALYEKGTICIFSGNNELVGSPIGTSVADVGFADCYVEGRGDRSYQFEYVDGWFSGCYLRHTKQDFTGHASSRVSP